MRDGSRLSCLIACRAVGKEKKSWGDLRSQSGCDVWCMMGGASELESLSLGVIGLLPFWDRRWDEWVKSTAEGWRPRDGRGICGEGRGGFGDGGMEKRGGGLWVCEQLNAMFI